MECVIYPSVKWVLVLSAGHSTTGAGVPDSVEIIFSADARVIRIKTGILVAVHTRVYDGENPGIDP